VAEATTVVEVEMSRSRSRNPSQSLTRIPILIRD
jgi:hypothetical protein